MISVVLLATAALSLDECAEAYPHRLPASGRMYLHAFDQVFLAVARERSVEPALLKAIAFCETRFDPCAVSAVGAKGVMQFMPKTFDWVASFAGAHDPFDPVDSIRSAGLYVAALTNYWKGDLRAVIASYNAGPTAVARARRRGLVIPAIAETEGYVQCVLGARSAFSFPGTTQQPISRNTFFGRLWSVLEATR